MPGKKKKSKAPRIRSPKNSPGSDLYTITPESAAMATTTVEWQSGSSIRKWEVAAILLDNYPVQKVTSDFVVYPRRVDIGVCSKPMPATTGPLKLMGISISNSVQQLHDRCFEGNQWIRRVTMGSLSCLERIGASCFANTGIFDVSIPDNVRELCDGCFERCKRLRQVAFGPSSRLERVGASCFVGTLVRTVIVPDNVREFGDCCFKGCKYLRYVIFGPASLLERIGA